jgi:hypothetical protein
VFRRAADVWPLLGFPDGIEKFDELLLAGGAAPCPCTGFGCRCRPLSTRVRYMKNKRGSSRCYFATASENRGIAAE